MAFALLEISVVLLLLITPAHCCYKAIFSFGDSLTDTGNKLYATGGHCDDCCKYPYGMTYFHKPTGRFSDGRIILDFIAEAFGLPMVPPYLRLANVGDAELFQYGVNFAVGGATAHNNSYFAEKGIEITWTEYSFSVQINEFKKLLPRLSSIGYDSSDILSKSLFILGEIGGNDYVYSVNNSIPVDEMKAMTPSIISTISSAIDNIIDLGAKVIVAPGVTPLGCMHFFISKYQNSRADEYDETGCLKWLNELAIYHNELLQKELDQICSRNPDVKIIYADYYNTAMNLYQHPQESGFEVPITPCFGSTLCSDPSIYVCWDGIHYTEAAYKIMAKGILEGNYADPPLRNTCTLISAY